MTKISCNIIEDLLPLYCDEVCSEESRLMIEGHLSECEHCTKILSDLQLGNTITKEDRIKNENEGVVLGKIAHSWKKYLFKSFAKGIIVAAVIFGVALGTYYGLFEYQGSIVIPEQVQSTGYMVTSEQISFKLQPIDGYCGGALETVVDEKGNLYIAIYRSIIKEELEYGEDEVMNYGFNQAKKQYNAVYYGTPDNNKLLWEQGESLPPVDSKTFD